MARSIMLRYRVQGLFYVGLVTVPLFAQGGLPAAATENYARLPLAFEKHDGGSGERFMARG